MSDTDLHFWVTATDVVTTRVSDRHSQPHKKLAVPTSLLPLPPPSAAQSTSSMSGGRRALTAMVPSLSDKVSTPSLATSRQPVNKD